MGTSRRLAAQGAAAQARGARGVAWAWAGWCKSRTGVVGAVRGQEVGPGVAGPAQGGRHRAGRKQDAGLRRRSSDTGLRSALGATRAARLRLGLRGVEAAQPGVTCRRHEVGQTRHGVGSAPRARKREGEEEKKRRRKKKKKKGKGEEEEEERGLTRFEMMASATAPSDATKASLDADRRRSFRWRRRREEKVKGGVDFRRRCR